MNETSSRFLISLWYGHISLGNTILANPSGSALRQQIVVTSHGNVHVKIRDGNGPALMLLHGNGFSGDVFARMIESPIFADVPLIIPDLPGHGLSDNAKSPANTYYFGGMASCINEVVQTLNIEAFTVFGWSLGGQIAIEMLDVSPGLIGVAACGSAIVQRGPLGIISGFYFTRDLLLAGKPVMSAKEARHFAEICTGDTNYTDQIMRTDPALRPALSRAALFAKGRDQRLAIADTQTPVCIMLGVNDPFIRAETLEKVKGPTLFGGRCLMLKDSGHAPFLQAPNVFDPALASFHAHAVAQSKITKPQNNIFQKAA